MDLNEDATHHGGAMIWGGWTLILATEIFLQSIWLSALPYPSAWVPSCAARDVSLPVFEN